MCAPTERKTCKYLQQFRETRRIIIRKKTHTRSRLFENKKKRDYTGENWFYLRRTSPEAYNSATVESRRRRIFSLSRHPSSPPYDYRTLGQSSQSIHLQSSPSVKIYRRIDWISKERGGNPTKLHGLNNRETDVFVLSKLKTRITTVVFIYVKSR